MSDGSVVRWPSPALDADSASLKAGADSNLRVCADTFDVVPDTPFPAADTRWAPAEACAAAPGDIAR
ncbi:MAG: hypothetical protein EXR69_01590 [Myxococcales bacterium]|nr:hypothetical protein [Myxococcales bacterium]